MSWDGDDAATAAAARIDRKAMDGESVRRVGDEWRTGGSWISVNRFVSCSKRTGSITSGSRETNDNESVKSRRSALSSSPLVNERLRYVWRLRISWWSCSLSVVIYWFNIEYLIYNWMKE